MRLRNICGRLVTKKAGVAHDEAASHLRVKGGNWRGRITVAEAGAAIERGGRFTDAIAFYEAIAKDKGEFRDFARRRWVLNKKRQLEHERAQNARARVGDIEREISKALAGWGLKPGSDDLPEFPELPLLGRPGGSEPMAPEPEDHSGPTRAAAAAVEQTSSEPPSDESAKANNVVVVLGSLKLELSRQTARCNLTQMTTMETGYVKIREGVCGGEVEFQEVGEKRWTCPPWNLIVQVPRKAGEPLVFELKDQGIELLLNP